MISPASPHDQPRLPHDQPASPQPRLPHDQPRPLHTCSAPPLSKMVLEIVLSWPFFSGAGNPSRLPAGPSRGRLQVLQMVENSASHSSSLCLATRLCQSLCMGYWDTSQWSTSRMKSCSSKWWKKTTSQSTGAMAWLSCGLGQRCPSSTYPILGYSRAS